MIRAAGNPLALAVSARAAIAATDPTVAQAEVTTMDALWADHIAQDRVGAIVIALFAAFGLLLAGLGVYGVMAYGVRQREAEIGVRRALGAASSRILADVLGRAAAVTALGLAAGTAGALVAGRVLSTMLFDVSAANPMITVGAVSALGLVSLLAASLPASRAVRIDPIVALRS